MREGGREKKARPKKEKTKKKEIVQTLPNVTPIGVGRTRILFVFVLNGDRHVRRMRVGIQLRGGAFTIALRVSSGGIRCGSCTSRGRCSSQIRVSFRLVGVVGIGGIASRGTIERVHVTVAPAMALTALAIHVVAREAVITEETGGVVGNIGRNRKPALGCRGILMRRE